MSLGTDFYLEASRPWSTMTMLLQRREFGVALNAVHYRSLVVAFHAAVERVRRDARVPRETIVLLLPEMELDGAALATAEPHGRAVEIWNEHQGALSTIVGGIIDGLVVGSLGIPNLGIGSALNGFLLDARLEGPFSELQAALQGYDQWLRWCGSILDGDIALTEAHRRARWLRRGAWTGVILGGLGMVGVVGYLSIGALSEAADEPSTATTADEASAPASASVPPPPTARQVASSPRPAIKPALVKPAPATPAPTSRGACLRSCVDACHDDANCERTCAASCPVK